MAIANVKMARLTAKQRRALELLERADRKRREADTEFKILLHKAQEEGLPVPDSEVLVLPDIKLVGNRLHIHPGGLPDPRHGHGQIDLDSKVARVLREVLPGSINRVIYQRSYGQRRGKWNECSAPLSIAGD